MPWVVCTMLHNVTMYTAYKVHTALSRVAELGHGSVRYRLSISANVLVQHASYFILRTFFWRGTMAHQIRGYTDLLRSS